MELQIKNKWVSLGGSSVIQDVNGNDVMKVKGKVFSFTRKKFVMDMDEHVKYIVRNKFWRLFTYKAFIMDSEENIKATVRRKIFSFHDRYNVDCEMGALEVIGNIFQFNYRIILNGKEIGHVARKFSLRDSFILNVDDSYDAAFLVALVIAIDNITDRKDSNAAAASSSVD